MSLHTFFAKKAAVAVLSLGTVFGASTHETKANDLGRILDGIQQGVDIFNQLQGGGPRYYDEDPGYHRSQRRSQRCPQTWYLPNGNAGGTYDPCQGQERPRGWGVGPGSRRGDFGGGYIEAEPRQRPVELCYKHMPSGRTVTGYSRNCQSDYRGWRNLQID